MEEAYRCTMGLANEEFPADPEFRRALKSRMRLNFGPLEDIAVGARTKRGVVSRRLARKSRRLAINGRPANARAEVGQPCVGDRPRRPC
jgi:hypothetical protein